MANISHYAVVIGLTDYPFLGDPPPNLSGPAHDAQAMIDWLAAADGGDVPNDNIQSLLSSPVGKPTRDDIELMFLALNQKAADNQAKGLGRRVGDRLYVYASGHGFSPTRNKGCLFAGNVSIDTPGQNVFVSAWLELFQDAGYFSEFVLWMDCCMNRLPSATPSAPTLASRTVLTPPGPTFIAFAAQRPLKAVERAFPEANGEYRGIFTWNLLQGLRGAAANRYGVVTGRSLSDWLRNSQRGYLEDADLNDREVAQEPEIVDDNDGLIFARDLDAPTYTVTLQLPDGVDAARGRLWRDQPPRAEQIDFDASGQATRALSPGLYLAEIASEGLRHGFEVTRNGTIDLSTSGPPVQAAVGKVARLAVALPEPGAELIIIDQTFQLVDRRTADLSMRLPVGLYKVRARSGRRLVEQVLFLDADQTLQGASGPALPKFSSAAPLPDTQATHEYHEAARAAAISRPPDVVHGQGGALLVMARTWTGAPETDLAGFQPWTGVRVVDADGREVAHLEHDGQRSADPDAWATCSLQLDPGTWYLRQPGPGGELEQCVVVCEGWRTEAHLLVRPMADGDQPPPRLTLLMRSLQPPAADPQTGLDPDQIDLLTDRARVALADERLILTDDLEAALTGPLSNPIAAILCGHLLLVENQRRPSDRITHLNEIVRTLRVWVGSGHPDVEALSLACPAVELRAITAPATPPMFEASWRLLVAASQARPDLRLDALWARVHAQSTLPPYLIWSSDEAAKAQHLDELRTILTRTAPGQDAEPEAVPEPEPPPLAVVTLAASEVQAAADGFAFEMATIALADAPADLTQATARAQLLGLPASALAVL